MKNTELNLKQKQIYQNIMEVLIQEEIERKLKFHPQKSYLFLHKIEIEAYALNRLPALYASSEQGREKQKELAQKQYQKQISLAVSRGLALVEQYPERDSRGLIVFSEIETKYQEAQKALQQLRQLLIRTQLLEYPAKEITWDNLVSVVKQALTKLYKKDLQQKLPLQQTEDEQSNLGWESNFIR